MRDKQEMEIVRVRIIKEFNPNMNGGAYFSQRVVIGEEIDVERYGNVYRWKHPQCFVDTVLPHNCFEILSKDEDNT